MKYAIERNERFTVIHLQNENLNSVIAPEVKSELAIFRNEGVNNLIFDLTAVKYVDSSGLSAILTGKRLWEETGTFILTGANASIKMLLHIAKLDTVLTLIPTVEEAIDYVMMDEIEKEIEGE